MARKKTPAVRVDVKALVSRRLRELRVELFGEHGGPELARRLNLPARTWYNYESGVTVPAEVLLGFIDQTGANTVWLLTGQGPRFRQDSGAASIDELTPQQLILKSLDKLREERAITGSPTVSSAFPDYVALKVVPIKELNSHEGSEGSATGQILADSSWIPNPERTIAAKLDDDAMSPILPSGSVVAIDRLPREPKALAGRIVAATVEGRPIIRWLESSGSHFLLRSNGGREEYSMIALGDEREASQILLGLVVWSWSRFESN